jgi:hypothetical protein
MVESGAQIAELTMTNGATLPLVRFSAGDVVPALDTLSAPAFSLAYRAEQPTQIAWLDDDHRAGWVRERATRAREAMLFSSMRQLTCLACLPATYRVYVELLRAARLARGRAFALPTHGELAARASTTRETVSRELSALRQDGVLSKGKVVTIVAPDALLRRIGRALNLEDAGDVHEGGGPPPVTLSTIHQAKGLEYDVVFLIGLADGLFPLRRAMESGDVEEERRLFYVGVTRARNELYLCYPKVNTKGGPSGMMLSPSRFLQELSPDLYEGLKIRRQYAW